MGATLFQGRPRFEEGLLEITTNRHDFACGLHRSTERPVGGSEFIKRPAWDFDHAVIQRGLKRCGRSLARDRIGQFIKRIAHGDFRRHTSDRVTRGF